MNRLFTSLVPLVLATAVSAQLTCTSTSVASSCATLSVTFTPLGGGGNQRIEVSATGLHPNAAGVMNWGLIQWSAPLPGPGCLLLCDFVWGHKFQTNDLGEFEWSRSWPHWYQQYFYMQVGSWEVVQGNLEFISTDCRYAGCQGAAENSSPQRRHAAVSPRSGTPCCSDDELLSTDCRNAHAPEDTHP